VLEPIASVEAVDPLTVRFHLKRPYAPLLAQLTFGILPRGRVSGSSRKLQDRHPIGAGPFRLVAWPDEDHLELAANDHFWAGTPKVPLLHVRVVRDETTRVLELLKGRADLVQNALAPAVLPVFASDKHLRVISRDGTGYAYLAFNLREKPLDDVRVRRAICMAIDVAPIVEHKFHGLAVPATGMLPREHWAYEKTTPCPHDLAAAKRLLEEAGYHDPDGDGPAPRMVLSFKTSTDRFRRSVALVLKDELAQIGIALDVRSLEFGTFFGDVRKGNFQLFTLKWAAIVEPDFMRSVFGSEFIPSAQNQFAGLNREAYANPELDALLERASHGDPALRRTLYGKAQEILAHDLPYLPLWHESTVAVASDRLQDFEPSSQGFFWPLAFAREVDR
jgi:peptide/nickel transport system substrate-binding protein